MPLPLSYGESKATASYTHIYIYIYILICIVATPLVSGALILMETAQSFKLRQLQLEVQWETEMANEHDNRKHCLTNGTQTQPVLVIIPRGQ